MSMSSQRSAARLNNATSATVSMDAREHPFAEGAFRWVAKGEYTEGERAGEPCVCKWFKSGSVFEASFFAQDLKAGDKAIEIVEKWNAAALINKHLRVNKPDVWTFLPAAGPLWAGRKVLMEPFIENYEKFNSNSGWAENGTPWPRVMQALSHFSYHITGGALLLCDLQGGVYQDGVVLTDPVIMSRDRQYGVTDLGPEGISSFFGRHKCTEFCKPHWSLPPDRTLHFAVTKGTRMMAPTMLSRAPMTQTRR